VVCILALDIRHAKRTRRIIVSPVDSLAVHIFSTYINGKSSGKKFIEYGMCVLISSKLLSETFPIIRRIQQDIINIHSSLRKLPCHILMKLVFSRLIFEKPPNTNSCKSAKWKPSCSMWTNRRTDKLPNLIVAFRNSANVPNKNESNGQMDLFLSPRPGWNFLCPCQTTKSTQ